MTNRVLIYFKKETLKDRYFFGDRFLQKLRNLFYKKKISSLELVFINLCKGLAIKNVAYQKNLPFHQIKPDDAIIFLGTGKHALEGYHLPNKIIAGIGLMTHPAQWPTIFIDYPVSVYLQHSQWTAAIYNNFFGKERCKIWPVGIDTAFWKPLSQNDQKKEILIYSKFLWDKVINKRNLLEPIIGYFDQHQIRYNVITYGSYDIEQYKKMLEKSMAMIFLCEHESQGIAYQEAMAMNVPILAWDQGKWLDKNRSAWGEDDFVPATSVPYFDDSCGSKFNSLDDFKVKFFPFYEKATQNHFQPRNYIETNLSLQKSADIILDIIKEVYF